MNRAILSGPAAMYENNTIEELKIPPEMLGKWQKIADMLAVAIGIPAVLIMRITGSDIEVFISSRSEGNPYHPGDREHFLGSGLYCKTVVNSNDRLLVPNALEKEEWKNNPDTKLNMISYLGYPIMLPSGQPFGTICVLDNKENSYSELYEDIIRNFQEVIQSQLEMIYTNNMLGKNNKILSNYISEIKKLQGFIPICSKCKKIRDDKGVWTDIETYITKHSEAKFSHGLCQHCADRMYGNQPWYNNQKIES